MNFAILSGKVKFLKNDLVFIKLFLIISLPDFCLKPEPTFFCKFCAWNMKVRLIPTVQ